MEKMPVIFIGHGSPMNAIEQNPVTQNWQKIASTLPRPHAIVMISAHWYTNGTRINDTEKPKMIYDMYGFPDELYQVVYPAPGNAALAQSIRKMLSADVLIDNSWGHDHGSWSVLRHMYPKADIPVVQIAIDRTAPPEVHYKLGQELKSLRERNILIIGSGNIVHNLYNVRFDMEGGYDWAYRFDAFVKDRIQQRDHAPLLNYETQGQDARHSIPTPDHYYPLLYVLGASDPEDKISVFNEICQYGTLSMTCYTFTQS
jgi:4,5-DOPA dioxygenase extradiol